MDDASVEEDQNISPSTSLGYNPPTNFLRHVSQSSLDESSQLPSSTTSITSAPYKNETHTIRAFETLKLMRERHLLCDVVLKADNAAIPAHKTILASSSPYFYAMFTGFEEKNQDTVTLQGIDPEALALIVDYCYSAEVLITEQTVQVLLPAANILQMNEVQDACCTFLASQLHPSNVLGIRGFADLHGCMELLEQAENFIEQHFAEVVDSEEFLALTPDQIKDLIGKDRLSVTTEEVVFESVLKWVQHDPENREKEISRLMELVRFPLMSKDYLLRTVEREPLVKNSSHCKDLLIEALRFHLMKVEDRLTFSSPRVKPREPVGLHRKILLVVGGQAPKAIRSVECYDFNEQKWFLAAEMPSRRCRAGVAVLAGKVYAVGGFNGSLRVRTVDVYDPSTDTWSTATGMDARRSTLGVAVMGGCIYAVGGFDGSQGLTTAERFDPETGIWTQISPMTTRRSSVACAVLGGILYAIGGYDGASRQCLSTVECYIPTENVWVPVPEMSATRSGAGVGVLNGLLYVVGGHDGPQVRRSVECYDPTSKQWKKLANMNTGRRNAGVVAVGECLYVVGGDDGASNLSSVEVFDPKTNSWNLMPGSMSMGRSYAGVAVVDRPPQAAAGGKPLGATTTVFQTSSGGSGLDATDVDK